MHVSWSGLCTELSSPLKVDVAEFFEFIEVERNLLCDAVISFLDESKSGELEFCACARFRLACKCMHQSWISGFTASFMTAVGTYCLFGMEEITKFVYGVILSSMGDEKVQPAARSHAALCVTHRRTVAVWNPCGRICEPHAKHPPTWLNFCRWYASVAVVACVTLQVRSSARSCQTPA